ncbi:Chitinase A1 precursor [Rubripirellula tenax]|uniref:chitinase n=1 Tax=Rubripirellula tenax TaxID=2528015 RepID=A0A5C6EFV9_9BACT|nr:glycoside hydrolase family 18 protein [Rubripirellula tenax]TWU47364.1 Chitinase A1 precursor [Rubripirellula tenax]
MRLLLLIGYGIIAVTTRAEDHAVVGYLPDYRIDAWLGDPGPVTDLVYFGLQPNEDGTLSDDVISDKVVEKLRRIKSRSSVTLWLTVGGWGRSTGFSKLAADPADRKRFIDALRRLCLRTGFDGVDYDWEHPQNDAESQSYSALICETKSTLGPIGLRVSVAQAGWQDLGAATYRCLDRVHLMAYDHDFPQATLEKAKEDVQKLIDFGCPRSKICLGIPFYGRNAARQSRTYAELTSAGAVNSKVSTINGFAFNSVGDVCEKVGYASREGLAGIMIWEITQDSNGSLSLLDAIEKEYAAQPRR